MSYGLNVEMHKQVSRMDDPTLFARRDGHGRHVTLISGSDGEVSLSASPSKPWALRQIEQR